MIWFPGFLALSISSFSFFGLTFVLFIMYFVQGSQLRMCVSLLVQEMLWGGLFKGSAVNLKQVPAYHEVTNLG